MKQLFLGVWWHWVILLASVVLMWLAGENKLHVTHFNWFVGLVLLTTIVCVISVVRGTKCGQQVTRDPIEDDPS